MIRCLISHTITGVKCNRNHNNGSRVDRFLQRRNVARVGLPFIFSIIIEHSKKSGKNRYNSMLSSPISPLRAASCQLRVLHAWPLPWQG